uniref:G-protein coupled receptors family 1 profile domain-containing protein n=1 Tax=Salmo trutta TaxID=8032 RepID=A0A674E8L8_SALTR
TVTETVVKDLDGDVNLSSFQGDLEDFCATSSTHQASRVILYAFFTAGIVCRVVDNFLVVLAIVYCKQLQSPTNSFVMSLAVADCLVGLVIMPYSMVRTVEGCWLFGALFCQVHSSLDIMLCTASIFHLSCIAFNRYYAMCNPLVYHLKMSQGRVAFLVVVCWAVPLLISFGPIMLGLHKAGVDMIYKAAKRQAMQISAMESQFSAGVGKDSSKKQRHRNAVRRERKAAKTLGIIMGVFLLFWLPFFPVNIVDPFIDYSIVVEVWEFFLWLGYVNSSLNPFLYGFFNRSFRRAFMMVMGCRICLSKRGQRDTQTTNRRLLKYFNCRL